MYEVELSFSFLSPVLEDLIVAKLVDQGFEGVWIENRSIKAYIKKEIFDIQNVQNIWQNLSIPVNCQVHEIQETNWNAIWESSFEPVVIGDKLLIKAPFHKDIPSYPIEIIIQPNMSFGTGHHPTTHLIAEYLLQCNLTNKIVLDAGTGTGILAILAEKLGAQMVYAFDIDKIAVQNSMDNIQLNACQNIHVYRGTISDCINITADYLIANINRNVLIAEMEEYAKRLKDKGVLIISGFLMNDTTILIEKAQGADFTLLQKIEKDNWNALVFKRRQL